LLFINLILNIFQRLDLQTIMQGGKMFDGDGLVGKEFIAKSLIDFREHFHPHCRAFIFRLKITIFLFPILDVDRDLIVE
jgi:hypothetical protein